jgi:hypothetical protein
MVASAMGPFDTSIVQLQSAIGHQPTFEILNGPDPIVVFCVISIAVIATLWVLAELLG